MNLTPPYRTQLIKGADQFSQLKEEWVSLWNQCPDATETQSWTWQSLYWQHVVPMCEPIFLVSRDGTGKLAGLGVFFVRRDRSSLLHHLQFLGEHDADYHLLLFHPHAPVALGKDMFAELFAFAASSASAVELSNMPQNSWTALALQEYLPGSAHAPELQHTWLSETYRINLPGSMDEYWELLSKKSREGLKYSLRRLRKDFEFEFRVPDPSADLDLILRDIESVDRKRWGHDSKFATGRTKAFLCATVRELFQLGICRIFLTYLNQECIAYNIGFQAHDTIRFPYIAADFSVAPTLSVGLLNSVLSIEHCIQNGVKVYDLTRGSENYKSRLGAVLAQNVHARVHTSKLRLSLGAANQRLLTPILQKPWLKGIRKMVRN